MVLFSCDFHNKELCDVCNCISMLSMAQVLPCQLEVQQPQPTTTVLEQNQKWMFDLAFGKAYTATQ